MQDLIESNNTTTTCRGAMTTIHPLNSIFSSSSSSCADAVNESDDSITPHVRMPHPSANEKDHEERITTNATTATIAARRTNVVRLEKEKQKRAAFHLDMRNSCIDPVAFTLLNEKLEDLENLLLNQHAVVQTNNTNTSTSIKNQQDDNHKDKTTRNAMDSNTH